MTSLMNKWAMAFQNYLNKWTKPSNEALVSSLVLNTAHLELLKSEYVELAPIKGCCGPFKLTGNSLPVFEYLVFEKKIMEFIAVRVEIARPDRISFTACIESVKTSDPKRHGEIVPVTDKYKEPFNQLSSHLFKYFPIYSKKNIKNV